MRFMPAEKERKNTFQLSFLVSRFEIKYLLKLKELLYCHLVEVS